MNNKEYAYIGDLSQLLRVEEVRLQGGKKDNVRAAIISNAKGLNFTVIADRCLDISHLSYKGINFSYINPCGIVAPTYYDPNGLNFLKSFTAGFMTTCGLNNVGTPCEDGERHGLHGRISHTPADEYNITIERDGIDNCICIKGKMKESFLFSEKLQLNRTIRIYQSSNQIDITDEIENTGFHDEEYMLLYHFNIGYPFLSPDCELLIDSEDVIAASPYSEEHLNQWDKITPPSDIGEMCYYHKMRSHEGFYKAGMFNHKHNIGFMMNIENQYLDHFIQWKNLSNGQYVMGFEPATNGIDGKVNERAKGCIKSIPARDKISHTISIRFFDSFDKK